MKVIDIYKKFNIEKNSDTEFAICSVLNKKRSELRFCEINKKQLKKFFKIYKQLKKQKPLDLILKQSNFYGRNFYVNKNVLKPRQDTEFVCEKAISLIKEKNKVLDLCCGSGVIGITLAKETNCSVVFADISKKALKVCKKNVLTHGIRAKIVRSDLLDRINEKFDVIVCNPPYIKTEDLKNLDLNVINFDPKLALDGKADGLEFYKRIIKQVPEFLTDEGSIVFEIGFDQAEDVKKLLKNNFDVKIFKDYGNNDRVVIGGLNGKTRKND